MNILVTGGAGFIGSHLCEVLVGQGHHVICVDNFNDFYSPRIKRANIARLVDNDNFTLVEADICELGQLQSLFSSHRIDFIYHLAARAGVRPSIKEPLLYQRTNIQGTVNLLELAREHGITRFVFASSSSVYGNQKKVPFSEEDPVDHPVSPYAATKKAGELICYTYHHLYGIAVNCVRFFTVYGPRQRPDMAIHKFTRLIDTGQTVPIYGDGSTRRDYTYISDIIDGLLAMLDRCNGYEIYNLGDSKTIPLMKVIQEIEKNLGKKAKIEHLPFQPGDVEMTYADISKAREKLGYEPRVYFEEGIRRFVEWYRDVGRGLSG
jgi:UDP-glucuronate 4-epimerase